MSAVMESLVRRYDAIKPHLTERQRRVWLGSEDPDLPAALDKLVDPDSRGDPMTPLRWTSKSLRGLADQLSTQGHCVSATLVGRLLHEAGYSLQANSKTLEGAQAIPYGVYDLGANTGWVSVGTDHETAAFAVNTLRTWWNTRGRHAYPDAGHLLITADSGGSNGNRRRTWKTELAALAAETGLAISVCHLPPGTSKWNKIEHRLFSQIT